MNEDQLIRHLRGGGKKFVFTYNVKDLTGLPPDRVRATLRLNFEKSIDSFFESHPSRALYPNEPERL